MVPTTRRVTVFHKGRHLQARIIQRYSRGVINALWKVELVKVRDESLYLKARESLIVPESNILPPTPVKGDLVRLARHVELHHYYFVTTEPKTVEPTSTLTVGNIESGVITTTVVDAVRFPTFDQELLCKCQYLPDEQFEQFLMSWEFKLVDRIITTDHRMWNRIVKPRVENWPPRVKTKFMSVLKGIVESKYEESNASSPAESQAPAPAAE